VPYNCDNVGFVLTNFKVCSGILYGSVQEEDGAMSRHHCGAYGIIFTIEIGGRIPKQAGSNGEISPEMYIASLVLCRWYCP
jgi:hypothetical protein